MNDKELSELIRKYEAEKRRLWNLSWCEDCEDIYTTLTELMDKILKRLKLKQNLPYIS